MHLKSDLTLNFLGGFEACWQGQSLTGIRYDKMRALLAYLAIESPQAHSRDKLADLLWENSPPTTARGNLRRTLADLRRAMEQPTGLTLFSKNKQSLQFVANSRIDVKQLLQSPPDCTAASACYRCQACITHLEQVSRLYRGDLLAGLALPDCETFESWLSVRRTALLQRVLAMLEKLAGHYERHGNLEQAITHSRRLIELDAWQEAAHRRLMRLLALNGQQAAALAQYESCRAVLWKELGIKPGAETTSLFKTIVDGELQPLPPSPPAISTDRNSRHAADAEPVMHFVGRESLLADLAQSLTRALTGNQITVFLNGEPGIGKSTLIQAFVRQSSSQALSIKGQCVGQYGQGEPYLPLLEAVNQLAQSGGVVCYQQLRRYAPTWLAQLPWLLNDQDRECLQRETQGVTKERMLRELGEFLGSWSQSCPLILVIEDIHWSDHATLDAIGYLSRRRDNARIMILGSYRSADVVVNEHPFVTVRNELLLHGLCRDLHLETLTQRDIAQYLDLRFPGRVLPDSLHKAVYLRSEGLPLFFARIADEMQAMIAGDKPEQALIKMPEGLKQLIEQQLDRLPVDERRRLDIAAVCGGDFSAATLAGVVGDSLDDVESWCEHLVRLKHLLRRSERQADSHYRFMHAYYQELAYERINPSRKATLHAEIGYWYELNQGRQAQELTAELAEHFERGRQYERASYYLQRAALNALQRHAGLEASVLLQRALNLMDEHLPDEPDYLRRKLDILTRLPAALVATQGYTSPELERLYRRALLLAEQLQDAEAQHITLYWIWMYYATCGRLGAALDKASHLFAQAENRQDDVQMMVGCYAIGTTLMFMGDHLGCDTWLKRGLGFVADAELCEVNLTQTFAQDPITCLWAQLAITRHALGDGESTLGVMLKARERAEKIGDPYTLTLLQIYLFWLHANRREPERIRDELPRIEQLAATHGFPFMQCLAQIYRGWIAATLDGDPSGIDSISQTIEYLKMAGVSLGLSNYLLLLAEAYLHHDQCEAGLRVIEDGLEKMQVCGERRYEAKFWLLRGDLLLRQGIMDFETIKTCFEKALAVAESQQARFLALRAACRLVELTEEMDEKLNAQQCLREIYRQFGEGFETPDLRRARALLDTGTSFKQA